MTELEYVINILKYIAGVVNFDASNPKLCKMGSVRRTASSKRRTLARNMK